MDLLNEIKQLEEDLDSVSRLIKQLSIKYNIPEDALINILAEEVGFIPTSIEQYLKYKKKRGRTPNWVIKVLQWQKAKGNRSF